MPKTTPSTSEVTPISGFLPLKVLYAGKVAHFLLIRKHQAPARFSSSARSLPEDRTLFLVNVPPDATARDLTKLFSSCGVIERILFGYTGTQLDADDVEAGSPNDTQDTLKKGGSEDEDSDEDEDMGSDQPPKPRAPKVTPLPTTNLRHYRPTGHTAHIIFLDKSSLQTAMELPVALGSGALRWPKASAKEPPSGLAHYTAKYDSLRPLLDIVKEHADTSLEAFEFMRSAAAKIQSKSDSTKGAIVDDDGFTLVTRGKHGRTGAGGIGVVTRDFQLAIQHGEQNEAAARLKAQQEKMHKKDFYTFQVREKKRSAFMEVRKKFEHDKSKIEKLKAKRRFKSY